MVLSTLLPLALKKPPMPFSCSMGNMSRSYSALWRSTVCGARPCSCSLRSKYSTLLGLSSAQRAPLLTKASSMALLRRECASRRM